MSGAAKRERARDALRCLLSGRFVSHYHDDERVGLVPNAHGAARLGDLRAALGELEKHEAKRHPMDGEERDE